MQSARAKGTAIIGHFDFTEATYGAAARQELVAEMPADYPQTGLIASAWYPFALFVAAVTALEKRHGDGSGALIAKSGGWIAEGDLKTVYRVFLRFMHPEFLISKSKGAWSQYYDSGAINILSKDERHVAFEGFLEPSFLHCQSVIGWSQRAIFVTGYKTAKGVHSECRTRGDARCVHRVEW